MPLLKSLICLKGHDNGRRFLFISLACYFLLVLLSPILNKAAILIVMLIAITTPILATTAIRRIHDAGFTTAMAAIPLAIYWLNLFGITYIEHGSRWALLILAVISTLAMATISNARIRRNHKYQIGYHGPVNLTPASDVPIHRDRIEPTIAGQKSEELHLDISQVAKQYTVVHDIQASTANLYQSQQNNWEQQLGRWFIANRKISIIAISTILCITLIVVILPVFENQPEPIVETKQAKIDTKKVRLNKIEMPDQFWMMLDQNDSLTIAWEGDFKTDAELEPEGSYWSASTGKGDKDCVDLHFSLGENIRTLLVTVKNGGDYYADFSPVDTETIVKSIAGKDRFKLCGYEFTLKGTRSLLRKNKKYTQFLKID